MKKLFVLIALTIPTLNVLASEPLAQFNLESREIFVTGLSSGGMMAVQYHAVFSKSVKGVAVLAAGPYHCAGDNTNGRMDRERIMPCLNGTPDAAASLAKLHANSSAGLIDNEQNLSKSRVYLFRGTQDQWVSAGVFNALRDYYRNLVPTTQIHSDDQRPVGHAFITDNPADPACTAASAPFVTNCGFDQAGDILHWLNQGKLQPRAEKASGRIVAFDQHEFTGPSSLSMEDQGYLYVPAACAAGEKCSLHLVFHGCGQGAGSVGDKVYGLPGAGFNRWADSNHMLVLYPQVTASLYSPLNPLACWDWWGYNDAAWNTHQGKQLKAIKAMVDRIGGR